MIDIKKESEKFFEALELKGYDKEKFCENIRRMPDREIRWKLKKHGWLKRSIPRMIKIIREGCKEK